MSSDRPTPVSTAPVSYDFDARISADDVRLQVVGPNVINQYRVVVTAGDQILAETLPTTYAGAYEILADLHLKLTGYCSTPRCLSQMRWIHGAGYDNGEMVFYGNCEAHYE